MHKVKERTAECMGGWNRGVVDGMGCGWRKLGDGGIDIERKIGTIKVFITNGYRSRRTKEDMVTRNMF